MVLAGVCWGLTGLCNRFITPAGFSQSQIMFMRGFIPLILLALSVNLLGDWLRDALNPRLR